MRRKFKTYLPRVRLDQAVTTDAAWQYFLEDSKGSIEIGKLADFVILSENPLTVAPKSVQDIKLLETM